MANKQAKDLVRLLKLLKENIDMGLGFRQAQHIHNLESRGRVYRISSLAVDTALKRGLVDQVEKKLKLTSVGEAALKRIMGGREGIQAQHQERVKKSIRRNGSLYNVIVNESESPLRRLATRKDKNGQSWIDEKELEAGERIRTDFERSGLTPRISANWNISLGSAVQSNGGSDISDFALDARKRLEIALEQVGPELSGVVLDVCCFMKGLECVEHERRWPPRSAKLMLKTALRMLSRHYGLDASKVNASMRHWAEQDYRPSI